MSVEITKVQNRAELKQFIRFNYELYKDNAFSVPDLLEDMLDTYNPKKNPAFEFCEAEYFLARRDGKIVGRVACIINHKANRTWNEQTARFGWIDFIDDLEVSGALLRQAEDWAREHHCTKLVGPLGFTDMDPEGMLTWGFDQLGTMATSYNYDYYPKHMEKLGGWEKDNDYVEYRLDVPETAPEKYTKIAEMVEKRYNLHARKLTKKDIFEGGYGKKLFDLINVTYSHLYGFSELSERQIDQYVKMYFPLADLDLITVVEDGNKDNQLVGLAITIPSLTRALQKCHRGRLFPFGWWHLLRAIKFHKTEVVDLLLIGVLPEYRSKGANSLVFADLIPRYVKYGFKWGETHVEMETNESVQSQWGPLDPTMHKKRRCYRKAIG